MRIALVMSHRDRSMGGAVRELHFLMYLRQAGMEVQGFRMHNGREIEQEAYMDGQVTVTYCPVDKHESMPHDCVSAVLVEQVNRFAPDVVIYKGLGYRINEFLQTQLTKQTSYGFIVGGGVRDAILDKAGFVFGEYEEQLARHFAPLQEQGRGFVMPKYINTAFCQPAEPVEKQYDIVNVGNFREPRKNQKDILPFSEWYRIALVGGGEVPEALKASAPRLDHVHILGGLPHAEVFNVLHRSRIMVHTSTMDGLPRAVVEAMACGLPVIVYRSTVYGGFQQGLHGFRVDKHSLRHAIHLLMKEESLRAEMSENCRRYVAEAHGPAAIHAAAGRFEEALRTRLLPTA